jgi:hypothetical protein
MPSLALRRKFLVLLLAAALVAPWASAAGAKPETATKATSPASHGLLARAWSLLTSLWSATGCQIDPNGRCVPAAVQGAQPKLDADTGCAIDPSGLCIR